VVISKRDSSAACPGASRKGKSAGHCARNDDSTGTSRRMMHKWPSICAGHPPRRTVPLREAKEPNRSWRFQVMRVTLLRDTRHFRRGEFGAG
jgi:hypothetical protein